MQELVIAFPKMIARQFFRSLHTSVWLSQATQSSLLATLRKKTGYTFVNCKKALELNENNIVKAEQWLKEQAQQHGWDQAMKLKTRSTTQGVIAMVSHVNHAALVEINSDHTVLAIGRLGENINIRRAACMAAQPKVKLYGCTHPAPLNPVPVSFGKYGALVALESQNDIDVLGLQLCQHVIGLNPLKVGNEERDEPAENMDDESLLIYQEFLLDPDMSVQQILQKEEAKIVDFVRFEVGETLEGESVDNLETCG
ncbi:hypothetical protein KM043_009220 [Ampulex compressa]|nr:hypothetical protein KM043_009220 [Ampulex compressa]